MRIFIEQENKWTSEGVETTYYVNASEGDKFQCITFTNDYSKAEQVFNKAVQDYSPKTKEVVKEIIL